VKKPDLGNPLEFWWMGWTGSIHERMVYLWSENAMADSLPGTVITGHLV
jgi:hypothetical protein